VNWTASSLLRDLENLGVRARAKVLTHSSFTALGPGEGSPATVIQAILDAVSPEGTALFPTHTWLGAGPNSPPTFDVRTSPSLAIGIIPEFARQWPSGVRSVHPTHSVVAIGAHPDRLTADHYGGGICSVGSPYHLLADEEDGWILLLGVNHHRNTSLHMPEELADIPGAFTTEAICRVTGHDGIERLRPSRFHTNRDRAFMRIDPDLTRLGIQRIGFVAEAECRLVHAGRLRAHVLTLLTDDPGYFFS